MRYLIITAAAFMAAPASAVDTAVTGSHAAPSDSMDGYYDWSGGYAGMAAGYGWMDGHFETAGYPPAQSELNGSILGVFGGFNIALYQALILGIEGDVEYNFRTSPSLRPLGPSTAASTFRAPRGYALVTPLTVC